MGARQGVFARAAKVCEIEFSWSFWTRKSGPGRENFVHPGSGASVRFALRMRTYSWAGRSCRGARRGLHLWEFRTIGEIQ